MELAIGATSDSSLVASVAAVDRADDAPALHGATLRIDRERLRAYVSRLAEAMGLVRFDDASAVELVRAAVTRRDAALDEIAMRAGVTADAIAVLAQLAAIPVLNAAARSLGASVSRGWSRGWCPICGAWPTLAESRGIERERRLRCGCCSADWRLPVLHCPFCDETDHRRLGSLAADGEEQLRRVETCDSCHGYIKSVTTLGALPPLVLAQVDLATVPLDIVAQERGYARPPRPARAPNVHLES